MEPSRVVFLVVDGAQSQALTRAWDRFDDPAVVEVDLYYRAATDVALVGVTLRDHCDRGRWIGSVVAAGVAVIDPARMSEGDRRAFLATYLASYEHVVARCPGVAAAMAVLRGRGPTPIPGARGTGQTTAVREPTPLPPVQAGRGDPTRRTALGLGAIRDPVPALPTLEQGREALPEERRARAPTVDLGRRLPPPPRPSSEDDRTGAIAVRFLRGGQWTPARLRSLSAKGAYLVTGAPPRKHDEVYVALELDAESALATGTVYHVTTARDAAATGSSGFAVRFATEATAARTRLLEFLHYARDQHVVIRPPPSRAAMRFPVRWQVQARGVVHTMVTALDVSIGGLFLATNDLALGAQLELSVPIDVGDPPVELWARVVRAITPDSATARGLAAGVGVAVAATSDGDRVRWERFLARVERRTMRTVIVGASLPRLELITRALTDAGYAVAPCADPNALLRAAERGALPDAAVIDDSLLAQGLVPGWLEQLFTAHQVPCVTLHGEASRARAVVDQLLAVTVG